MTTSSSTGPTTNGGAMAALVAAGVGCFAMGFFVLANEVGLLVAPTLYGPAGGVSGRTTLAVVVWLVAWGVLHSRWRARELDVRRTWRIALLLVALGLLGTFPPFWGVFG